MNIKKNIYLRNNREWIRVTIDSILYIKSRGNVTLVVLDDEKIILTSESFQDLLGRLPDCFFRVHRSYIVNTDKIERVRFKEIILGSYRIPIGPTRLESLFSKLDICTIKCLET